MESERNCRLIITLIIVNMLTATLLLVYLFHMVIFGGVSFNGERPSADIQWPLRIAIAVVAFIIINVQLTFDLIFLKNLPHLLKAIESCQHWLKMTTAFQVLQILGFLFSIFHEGQDHPYYIMPVIVISNILSRAYGLYQVNSLLTFLQSEAPLGLQPGHILFLSLPSQFYRSHSTLSVNSIAPSNV